MEQLRHNVYRNLIFHSITITRLYAILLLPCSQWGERHRYPVERTDVPLSTIEERQLCDLTDLQIKRKRLFKMLKK